MRSECISKSSMNKLFLVLILVSQVLAGNSTFSGVRTISTYSDGSPKEEAIDITICLEKDPTLSEKPFYENIIRYLANGIYEATNGGNYLGRVIFYPNGRFCSSADVEWENHGGRANSSPAGFLHNGVLMFYDDRETNQQNIDLDDLEFNLAMIFLHEMMHYVYGLHDEYPLYLLEPNMVRRQDGSTGYNISISANPANDVITITKETMENINEFKVMTSILKKGAPVVFFSTNGGRIPAGLSESTIVTRTYGNGILFSDNGFLVRDYAVIDQVWDDAENGVYSFNLKDFMDQRVDIQDAGVGIWGISYPDGISTSSLRCSAHSITCSPYDIAASRQYGGKSETQWQWANVSTPFNLNEMTPQGMTFRDENGQPISGWEMLEKNPDFDLVYGMPIENNTRHWFKSLKNRSPRSSDVYTAKSYLLNYDEVNARVLDGYAKWMRAPNEEKNLPTYTLPYMKVEFEGKSDLEIASMAQKYLEIEWVDNPEVEVIVLVDASLSMLDCVGGGDICTLDKNGKKITKMSMAKQAAKFVSQGFLGYLPKTQYDVSNVLVGVYSFNDVVFDVYPPRFNPDVAVINASINQIRPNGATALYDALYAVGNSFSDKNSSLKVLYVISDGLDVASTRTKDDVIKFFNENGISIHAFAYGANADRELLSSLASETGGSYFENEEHLPLKVADAVAAAISSISGNEQLESSSLTANSVSSEVYIPARTKLAKVYGEYAGNSVNNPIEIVSKSGSVLPVLINGENIGEKNYFVAEIDSLTLANLSESFVKVKNKLSDASVDYRIIATNDYHQHSLSAKMYPMGPFEWPSRRSFSASVRGDGGLLADVDVTGKLIDPDGVVQTITMHDDGANGDFRAGDGIFFAALPTINKNGSYQWEISASNKNGRAHTTRVGTSLPNSIPFVEKVDDTPFELLQNGQFVVTGCCSEGPPNSFIQLPPETRVNAFLQSGADADRFEIVGTQAGKSYSLRLSSMDLQSFDKIVIYAVSDKIVPVYTVNVEHDNDNGFVTVPLAAEYALPGYIVSVIGSNSNGANYDLLLLEKSYAEFAVGRFEIDGDWHSMETTLSLDSKKKREGMKSLVTPAGWKTIESRNISSADFELVGEKMSLDVFVPLQTQNVYWIGNVELWMSVPSSNKRIQIGQQQNIQPYFGNWKSYEFDMPTQALELFAEPHSDIRFQIVLNSADSLWIDNLRFAGTMSANPVNKWTPQCPDDNGCDSARPLQLRVNESIRVVAEGDLWIEIVGFPNDWTPAKVNVGVSAEDGASLTGHMTFENETIPLIGWCLEHSIDFVSGKRYLLKLYNLGGRPYRLNAWASGGSVGLSVAKSFESSVYEVDFLPSIIDSQTF